MMREGPMRWIASILLCAMACATACATARAQVDAPADPPGARAGDAEAKKRPRAAVRALAMRLPEVRFADTPLEDVFAAIGAMAGVNVVVRWEELERVGIERTQPVSLTVRNVRLSQALWLVMNEAAPDGTKLAYRADDTFIVISSVRDLDQQMIVRVYDVNDLLASRLRRPTFGSVRQHTYVAGSQVAVAGGAVGSRPITEQVTAGVLLEGDDPLGEDPDDRVSREAHMRQLMQVIVTTIEPDSWAENGGQGTMASFRGLLVVRNSPLVHQQIGGGIVE
ncbi:MAG TPA: hypothetical protein PKC49_13420 [Phycisphaerae bacterium]|nr:hypothetical protein [Phycisphaerae bacterium]